MKLTFNFHLTAGKYLLGCLCFFISSFASAQFYKFHQYLTSDGLPQSFVYTLIQDAHGFIWIGTGDGLARFDGISFQRFSTQNKLAENYVTSSYLSSDNTLWFGHHQGGLSLSKDGKTFRSINTQGTIASPITQIIEDTNHDIWVVTLNNGIFLVDKSHARLGKVPIEKSKFLTYSIAFLPDQRVLLGTDQGLFSYKLEREELNAPYQFESLKGQKITCLTSTDNQKVWIGTEEQGIFQLSTTQKSAKPTLLSKDFKHILDIQVIGQDQLWVSELRKGVSKLILTKNASQIQEQFLYQPQSGLATQNIRKIFEDREGNIWLGSTGDGLFKLDINYFLFYQFQHLGKSNQVFSVNIDSSGNKWLGTENGILKIPGVEHEKQNNIEVISQQPKEVSSILQSKNGTLWVGTKSNGLFQFNPSNKVLRQVMHSSNNPANFITDLIEYEGHIWAGTKEGIYILNPQGTVLDTINTQKGLVHNRINCLYKSTTNNKVYVGTQGNFLIAIDQEKQVERIAIHNSSPLLNIRCITEDQQGNLWLGTAGNGLLKFVNAHPTIYTSENGLLSDYCYSVITDTKNNIWVGHRNGLSKLVYGEDHFKTYTEKEGIENEFHNNAAVQDTNGNLWFGSDKGLVRYNIADDQINTFPPQINLLSIKINDEPIPLTENLQLPYGQYKMEFEFRGVSLKESGKVTYTSKLEGYDLDWTEPSASNQITYPRVEEGEFTLQVKAFNSDGIASTLPLTLHIEVALPIWKKPWFIGMVVLILAFLVYLYIRYRVRKLELENEKLEKVVSKRTQQYIDAKDQLKAANEELQRMNMELEKQVYERTKKLRKANEDLKVANEELDLFVYRASHDLKGPLARLTGLTNIAKLDIKEDTALSYLDQLESTAHDMDSTLDKLLMINVINRSALDAVPIDFHKLLDEIRIPIDSLLSPNKIQLKVDMDGRFNIHSDEKLIKMILSNLIENSITFRSQSYKVEPYILVNAKDEGPYIRVNVADNGSGIPKEHLPKIFNMFFRGSELSKGNGLGLYVVKKAIDKLGGTVTVKSEVNKFTIFEIKLPKAKPKARHDQPFE
ncbi:two-component regulator propeller domain-containing protein [Rapidithrix thailandica]|uniref:histidine kinase n=1 Tax=Rapidithrix thailandica TaxID=413964 RepID=A0AAW9RPJ4_9BACT